MPRDKSKNHEKIINAAYEEFLEYGFKDASMRRIAAACDMSASGLYKHFPSKEDMFAALVGPAYEGMIKEFFSMMDDEIAGIDKTFEKDMWKYNEETVWILKYVYKHIKAFKLLVCRSQGTRYENYIHELAVLEEESTHKFISKMEEVGIEVHMLPDKEYHLFITTNISAIFQPVEHDFTEEEALSYGKHLDSFYEYGWRHLMQEG
ncbi:MAG: TetR/AcrR family transcriptional regulator [Lachnospiraceae bacterium]|nr:TetR/AcrR family transcriptional regulator [Lachnospiraceae bacterium]